MMAILMTFLMTYAKRLKGALDVPPASSQNSNLENNSSFITSRKESTDHHAFNDQREQQVRRPKFGSALRFVMVVGLEGTGHHFMGEIAKNSPFMKTLHGMNLAPEELANLELSLFNNMEPANSLWNAHCATEGNPNIDRVQSMVVKHLEKMEQVAKKEALNHNSTATGLQTIHVPLNTLSISPGSGMISYPNELGDCRKLNYPSLDLLYRACDMAGVDCGHVYIYRDPAAILHSTVTNRHFSDSMLEQIHLYKSMYNIIMAELMTFPDRTWGCYGLLDASSIGNTTTGTVSHPSWWQEVSRLWGWSSVKEFNEYMKSVYKAPKPVGKNLVSSEFEPYMDALIKAHQKVISVCQKTQSGELESVDPN
ncbi:expressed unknown protein [Seminavis robusta]|uniref:Sulfotransferase n=1 Tax=Seminavis robusta TaxID=568900 RepID=A0A9N8HL28_9STRA|nr:expressed unknown protein [Seminavis robusta]|eukprot:Sro794_g203410.1 n/a (367) ;mRNA; f:25793-26893